jgi:hypothetical protein
MLQELMLEIHREEKERKGEGKRRTGNKAGGDLFQWVEAGGLMSMTWTDMGDSPTVPGSEGTWHYINHDSSVQT